MLQNSDMCARRARRSGELSGVQISVVMHCTALGETGVWHLHEGDEAVLSEARVHK